MGDYTVGVWFGTVYETILHEVTVHRFRLEGAEKGRPKRIMDLGLPWQVDQGLYEGAPEIVSEGEQG